MENKGVIIFTLIAIAIILIIARIFEWPKPEKNITDFTSCAEAGFPITETYPRQCIDKNQKVFIEEVTAIEVPVLGKKLPVPTETASTRSKTSTSSSPSLKNSSST